MRILAFAAFVLFMITALWANAAEPSYPTFSCNMKVKAEYQCGVDPYDPDCAPGDRPDYFSAEEVIPFTWSTTHYCFDHQVEYHRAGQGPFVLGHTCGPYVKFSTPNSSFGISVRWQTWQKTPATLELTLGTKIPGSWLSQLSDRGRVTEKENGGFVVTDRIGLAFEEDRYLLLDARVECDPISGNK